MAHLVGGLAALLGRYSMVRTSQASSGKSDNSLNVTAGLRDSNRPLAQRSGQDWLPAVASQSVEVRP